MLDKISNSTEEGVLTNDVFGQDDVTTDDSSRSSTMSFFLRGYVWVPVFVVVIAIILILGYTYSDTVYEVLLPESAKSIKDLKILQKQLLEEQDEVVKLVTENESSKEILKSLEGWILGLPGWTPSHVDTKICVKSFAYNFEEVILNSGSAATYINEVKKWQVDKSGSDKNKIFLFGNKERQTQLADHFDKMKKTKANLVIFSFLFTKTEIELSLELMDEQLSSHFQDSEGSKNLDIFEHSGPNFEKQARKILLSLIKGKDLAWNEVLFIRRKPGLFSGEPEINKDYGLCLSAGSKEIITAEFADLQKKNCQAK